jgi:hypothetical protein
MVATSFRHNRSWPGLSYAVFIRENQQMAPGIRVTRPVADAHAYATEAGHALHTLRGDKMAAMKPRTGDGPLEVTKEGRGIVMRVPLEGGGRLVVEMTPTEATALGDALKAAAG